MATTIGAETIEILRRAGYVVVPLQPTEEMLGAGVPACFSPYDGTLVQARRDALECYLAMVEAGRLK